MENSFNKLITILKILVLLAVLYYGINPFLSGGKFQSLNFSELLCLSCISLRQWLLIALFSLLNWGLETFKWKIAAYEIEKISFQKALMGVLSGAAISCLVPWKAGEFIGKVSILKTENKLKGSILALLTSMSQYAMTILFGIIGFMLIMFGTFEVETEGWGIKMEYVAFISILILITLLLMFFPFRNKLLRMIIKITGPRWRQFMRDFNTIPQVLVYKLWALSLIRYLSFIVPYVILIDPELQIITFVIPAMMTIFLIQSLIPGFLLSDLPVKGLFHLIIFSTQVSLMWKVGNAVFLVFIFNQLVPAFLGGLALWFYNPEKKAIKK